MTFDKILKILIPLDGSAFAIGMKAWNSCVVFDMPIEISP